MSMKRKDRSPLTDEPLRNPGQSVEEARAKLLEDQFETPGLLAAFFIALAVMEWWRYLAAAQPRPLLFTLVAVGATAFALWRLWRVRPQSRALRQAAEGEKAVGQFLERLRKDGYQVFHDLLGNGFNVDHVLIGPAGVFTVETKTWTKPARGDARIKFDGERILVGDHEPDRNPVIQARAQAAWLKEL